MRKFLKGDSQEKQALEDDYAPLVTEYFIPNETFYDIDLGVFDYVFKCVGGPYKTKYFYVNTSPHGEVIGGSLNYDLKRNSEKLTIYMENCNLSTKHAVIQLNSYGQYSIQDLSTEEYPGIWVKVPTSGEGLDIYKNRNQQRLYMIKDFQYMFHFSELEAEFKDFFHWMRLNKLDKVYETIAADGIDSFGKFFSNLKDLQIDVSQQVIHLQYEFRREQMKDIQQCFAELKNAQIYIHGEQNLKNKDKKHVLRLEFSQGASISLDLNGNQGFLIGSHTNHNATVPINDSALESLNLYIVCKYGSYYMVADHTQSNHENILECESPYFSLFKDERFNVQPGNVLIMGSLTYQVQRFQTGVIADCGARNSMEDTYVIVQDLGIDDYLKCSLFAAIDGHGGFYCAQYLRQHLESEVRKHLTDINLGLKCMSTIGVNEVIANALREAFISIDEKFFQDLPEVAQKCGATMVCVMIIGNRIFCANVGDSRAVLSRNGKAINLSFDHKTVMNYY